MSEDLARKLMAAVCCGACLTGGTAVWGQTPTAESRQRAARPIEDGPSVELDVNWRLSFRSDVRGAETDVQVNHVGVGVTVSGSIEEKFRLIFGVDGEYLNYDFTNGELIMPAGSEPFDDLYGGGLSLAGTYSFEGPWSVTVGGFFRASGESGAEASESIFGGGFAAVGYAFSEGSWVSIGLGSSSRLEDDATVFPYIAVRIPISERVRLESRGLGVAVIATLSEELEFALKGAYENRQFRLNDDRPAYREGVLRDTRVPIGAELIWKPLEGLMVSLEGGAVVYQEFEFLTSGGDEISDFETEPAAFVGLRFEYRF